MNRSVRYKMVMFIFLALVSILATFRSAFAVEPSNSVSADEFGTSIGSVFFLQSAMSVFDSECAGSNVGFEATWTERNLEELTKAKWILAEGLDELALEKGFNAEDARGRIGERLVGAKSKLRSLFIERYSHLVPGICMKLHETVNSGAWDVRIKYPAAHAFLKKPWRKSE
jgi:hypothetical protein